MSHRPQVPTFPPDSFPLTRFRLGYVSLLAVLIGVLAALAAYGLSLLIGLVSNLIFFRRWATDIPSLANHHLGWFALIVPTLGGMIIGIMGRYGSPKIRGHGIPEAMEAMVFHRSRIAPRVALLKPISAAISIGTGGPFGAEGPIIQTGGALGSLVGQAIRTTAAERKILLSCGAAAGMAAGCRWWTVAIPGKSWGIWAEARYWRPTSNVGGKRNWRNQDGWPGPAWEFRNGWAQDRLILCRPAGG